MKRTTWISLMSLVALSAATSMACASPAGAAQAAPQDSARLMVVQALPGQAVDVSIDGDSIGEDTDTGSVLGPFDIPSGAHEVTFSNGAGDVLLSTDVDLAAGSSQDLVVHLPAEVDGDPVATQYETPTDPIGVDKARVLIAHTASVAPADVRVDGTVVFTNIANGEFAVADVAAGDHIAELLPSGLTERPILGPINVTLPAQTATMVYAIGDPKQDSMEVIAHSISLSGNGADAPTNINAGSAGLASDITVTPFSPSSPAIELGDEGRGSMAAYGVALAALLALAVGVARRRRFLVEESR